MVSPPHNTVINHIGNRNRYRDATQCCQVCSQEHSITLAYKAPTKKKRRKKPRSPLMVMQVPPDLHSTPTPETPPPYTATPASSAATPAPQADTHSSAAATRTTSASWRCWCPETSADPPSRATRPIPVPGGRELARVPRTYPRTRPSPPSRGRRRARMAPGSSCR